MGAKLAKTPGLRSMCFDGITDKLPRMPGRATQFPPARLDRRGHRATRRWRVYAISEYWSLPGGLMNSIFSQHDGADARRRLTDVGRGLLRFSWTAVRVPLLALLVTLEPIICWVLSAIALLGVLVSLMFEFVVRLPNYPFWLMMGISAAIAALQIPYYLLIRLFSSR